MSNPFDQFDAKTTAPAAPAANPFDQFDPAPAQDNALVRGFKKSKQSIGLTASLATGDAADTAKKVAEADSYAKANPGTKEGAELMDAWNKGDGVMGGVKNVAGEVAKDWNEAPGVVGGFRSLAKNAAAMGSGIVEQVPNMIAPMAGMIAGGAAGGAAGSAVPVIGNAVGAAVGGFAGAGLGNAAVEGGGMLQDELQKAGINPQDQAAVQDFVAKHGDRILGQAGVKGGIIGAVDTATAGLGHWLLTGPGKAAASRALTTMGVDMADKAAVKAATESPEFAAKVASDAAYKAQTSGAQGLVRNVGAAAMEPAGEFAGEYVGQGVANGDWDTKNAALEAFSSLGQSGAMFAGQKAIQYATSPLGFKAGGANADAAEPGAVPGAVPGTDPNGLTLAPLDQQQAAAPAGQDVMEPFPGGKAAVQSTFDPRNPQSQPPMALMPKADESGVSYEPTGFTPRRPSEVMGLDPNAGTLSAAATVAVDSGASPVAPAPTAAPGAAPAEPAPTLASAAGKAAGIAPGGAAAQAQAAEGPDLSGWSEDELRAQLRSAQGKGVRLSIAQELGSRREAAATKSAAAAPAASPAPAGEWQSFPPESGTLGVPRAEMPQVKAEHRGPMVNFLKARGIDAEQAEVPASSLKPTQAEYSTEKVAKALGFTGTDRSILVSADGHVLDGHHQWLAKAQANEPVKVIRLNAPIKDLLSAVKEFPSSTVDTSSATSTAAPAAPAAPTPAAGGTSKLASALAAVRDQKKARAEQASQAAASAAAPAEPSADIRTITAKQIPDMTDDEIRQAIAHYGPDHKRTAKLERALVSRGVTTTETTQEAKNEPSTTQTQQAEAQGPEAPAAPGGLSQETLPGAEPESTTQQAEASAEPSPATVPASGDAKQDATTPAEKAADTSVSRGPDASKNWVNEGKTPAQLTEEKAIDTGHGLALQVMEESRADDFDASELSAAVKSWADDAKVPADSVRIALAAKIERSDLPKALKKKIADALNPAKNLDGTQKPGLKKKADAMRAKADRMEAAGGDAAVIQSLRDQAERDYPTPAAPAAPSAEALAAQAAEMKRAAKEVERELFTSLASRADLIGKDVAEVAKAVQDAVNAGNQKTAINGLQVARLARAIHKQLAKNAREIERNKHRDPEVYAAAVSGAAAEVGIEDPAQVEVFKAGWAHALAGKTKSTLAGEGLADMLRGYEAASAWMGTEEGAAWYEGRPSNKLKNTGVDLRRHWEDMKAAMKAGESDTAKAWSQIERATERAALLAPLLPKDAKPGFVKYFTELRGNIRTFKQWLQEKSWDYNVAQVRGSDFVKFVLKNELAPQALSKEDQAEYRQSEEFRIKWLQDQAADYIRRVSDLTGFMSGANTVKEAAEKFDATYMDGTLLNPAGRQAASRFSEGSIWEAHTNDFAKFRSDSNWTEHLIDREDTLALPNRANPLTPPKLDRVERTGLPDYRKGENITPEQFKKAFGFADVGFGNWVGAKQDQDHLNYAYDALMDLAQKMGMAPQNVGFGGRLHFTIGALGHGKFAAHFSPNHPGPSGPVQVINLTNTKGDGTVFHEWIHALDHFLGGDWKGTVRNRLVTALSHKMLTVDGVNASARRFLNGGAYWKGNKRGDRVHAAIQGINYYVGSRNPQTAFKTNADALGKDYWGNEHELIARASEAWAADTLAGKNDYLVNAAWVGDGAVTAAKGYRGSPYPAGDERKTFAKVFDALAKSIKWEDGHPTVARADFDAAIPDDLKAGEKRRLELQTVEAMTAYRDEMLAVDARIDEVRQADKAAEREEMDRIAAEKLAELKASTAAVDEAKPDQTTGPLSDDDLSALFDQAAAELREEAQEKPDTPAPGLDESSLIALPAAAPAAAPKAPKTAEPAQKAEDKSAVKLIAEAAKLGVKGADEALRGLSALFGGPGRLNSFPGGFDEETYQKAKPHFEAALSAFQDAGKSLKDLFKLLINQFGDGVKDYAIRFAKDQNLTAQLGSAKTLSASGQVAQRVADRLAAGEAFDWRALFAWADEAFGGTQAEGKYTPKDAYDAMEAGVNQYMMREGGRAFTPNVEQELALSTVGALERMTALLPTQTKRTAEQDEFQQFSTVPALAYAANWAANITSADTMMEPSAGIGGLATFAKNAGAKLILNELSSRRAALLQEVFPASKVFTENAEQIHNILPADTVPSVVVMNPPFSATAGRMQGYRNTQVGGQHVEQALKRLAKGGRLVAIVGEGMAMDRPAFKDWWAKIGAEYDVRAVIPMDGSGYAKYGTTFDNAILVIDKVKPSGRPVVTTKATTYTELVSLLSEIRNERPAANIPSTDFEGIERDAAESARLESVQAGPGEAAGPGERGQPGDVGSGDAGGRPALGGRGDGKRGPGRSDLAGDDVREPGGTGADGRGRSGGRGDDASAAPGGSGANEPGGLTVSAIEAKTGELTDSVFENYQPQRLQVPGAKPHPGPLVQSSAMASVLPPAPTYVPNLPAETIKEGKLSIAQIESVVYAGQAHSEFLGAVGEEQPARRGFFIGDGTGVGKGREISGILLDNLRQGRTKAVWVSEKQGLMNDAKRDFGGVGGDAGLIFNQNKTKAEDQINAGDGIIFTTYSTLRSGAASQDTGKGTTQAQLAKAYPAGTPAVVSNSNADLEIISFDLKKGVAKMRNRTHGGTGTIHFSRIQSIDGKENWFAAAAVPAPGAKVKKAAQSRLDQLVSWLGADFDGVIAFDEAHNAGNAVSIKGERGASDPSAQALAVVDLQKRLPKARVVYVSATGATQVSNLSYATRLGLWGPGTPFPSVHNFIAEMNAGGLAAMELVARDMKQMGAYIARSLSFDGVTYSRVEHELTPAQVDIYNRMAEAWQVTLRSIEKALEVTGATGEGGKGKSAAKSAAKSAYWGAQQRFFNQIITSMQMPTVLEQIERDLAAGDAVVLQLVNTNEAQQNRAVEKRKEEGESTDLEGLDLTPRDMLVQMVEKSYPVVQYETTLDGDGKAQRVPVKDSEGNPVLNREAIEMRDQLIKDLHEIRVPDGPLEIIMNHFGADKVAEVTGRTQRVVRKADDEGNIRAQLETRGSSAARADADAFMADKKQLLAFSDAGGTGFSFHADLTKENQRKRKHYLIQPGWRADKAVQGFGRTHRTNQKSAPHYYLASTNIPAQKRFLSAIARRLDQLGALTKGQRDTANQGLFSEKDNLESQYATQAVRQLIEDMKGGRALGLNFQEFLRQTGLEDIVDPETNQIAESKIPTTRLFLNRMLSLDLKMQDKVFDAFIDRMSEKIDMAIERGQLDTGMQTIRAMESKVLNDAVAYTDLRTSAETRLVDLELTQPTTMFRFPELASGITWVQNRKSGRVWGKSLRGQMTLKNGAVVDRFAMTGTSGTQTKDATEFSAGPDGQAPYTEISKDEARELWAAENAKRPPTYTQKTHMVVGAMLPIWDRLKTSGTIRVARTQTTDGQRLLGMVVDPKSIGDLRKRLNVDSGASKLPAAEVMARILKGDHAELANGWTLERVRVSGDLRIEIKPKGYLTAPAARELTGMGVVNERISWTDRYFVPTGADGVKVLDAMFQTKPVVDLANPNDAETEGPAFGRVRPTFSRGAQQQANVHVQGVVSAITSKWENAPRVVVAFDMNDPTIPQAVRDEDARQREGGAEGTPEGFYHNGDVYLLASKLNTNADVARVLFHESIGHFGLRGAFGKTLKPILQQVALFRKAEVEAKIKEYGLRGVKIKDRLLAAEEVLAELAQTKPEIGFVQRAIAAIRTWLRENVPFLRDLAMSNDEIISNFLLPARGFVERANNPTPQAALAFSRSAMKSADANVERGRSAMNRAIVEKADQHRAMFRPDLGWVDFAWGDGKKGIQHILAQRQAKDGMSYAQAVRLLTHGLVDTIAKGEVARRIEIGKSIALHLDHDGHRAILLKNPGSNAWMLTGYELRVPGGPKKGFDSKGSTQGAPTLTRGTLGASTSIISATDSDGNAPLFSRSAMSDMAKKATDQIALTVMHTPGKLSIWHKTLGTQYNLAERSPAFKRVFDAAQGFIDDVAYFASEAADLAPKLLPKLETWRDITKSPTSAADNKAISTPIFEGTLEWRRDESGKPVRVNELKKAAEALSADQKAQRLLRAGDITQQMLRAWRSLPLEQYEKVINERYEDRLLKAGIVWTDAELKSMFKLNDGQIGLYKEFRQAVDKSIDTLAKSDMLRLGGEELQPLRDAVMDAADAHGAAGLVADYLRGLAQAEPGRATQLMQTANSVIDRADQAGRLKAAGYAPLSRFGRYTVDVVGKDGERVYFGMYETAREANLAAMQFKAGYPDAAVTQGTMSEEAYKLFAGVTPESLEMFGEILGLNSTGDEAKDQAFQEYLRLTKNNRSALKHLIHRKGIDGYSTDAGRVLATFLYSNARRASGGVHIGDMTRAIAAIPKEEGELKDAAQSLAEYVQNPREEAQALRGLLFTQYLGGSIASAMVNMTQPLAVSLPYLSQYGGAKRAGAELLRAIKGMATKEKYEPALAEALRHAEEDGTVSPQEIHQLMAQARGSATLRAGDGTRTGEALATGRNALSRLGLAWGKVFGAAEQVNRRSTYIAAFRLAVAQGHADPAAFAKKAVHETQFVYSKANKNVWGRGAIGGTLMTFKTYGIAYMELLTRMWGDGPEGKKAVLLALVVMFLLGGAGGLPFAEDLEDVADGIGQSLGYNFSSKKARQEVLEDLFGQAMADFMDKGITGLPGVPIDVSGRLGMGNLLPGTGLLVHKSSHANDLKELAGPAGDLVQRGFQAAGQALTGDLAGAALTAAPRAVSNATKGLDMLARGMYRDDKGYKVLDTGAGEGVAKLIGFQPADVAKIQEANYLHQRAKDLYNTRAQEIRAQWARGIFEKDQALVDEARADLADWNEKNPDQHIKPDMPAILRRVHQMAKSKDQRIADTAPKAMRAQMRKENAEVRQTL